MTVACLTCAEIEARICELADALSSLSDCEGMKIREDDTTFDLTPQIEAKKEVLRTYQDLYKTKCVGSMDLYEFIHTPCTKPANCAGSGCNTAVTERQNRRRYRR